MAKFAVEECPNKEFVKIHFSFRVPAMCPWDSKKNTNSGDALRSALESIDGVIEAASFDNYSIRIQRGGVFAWDEIVPKVVDTVMKVRCIQGEIVKVAPYGK